MMKPGARLRSVAARVFSAATMERVIDPALADLEYEHAEAVRQRRTLHQLRIRIAGCWAFWKVVGKLAIEQSSEAVHACVAADDWAMGRALAASTVVTLAVTCLVAT